MLVELVAGSPLSSARSAYIIDLLDLASENYRPGMRSGFVRPKWSSGLSL